MLNALSQADKKSIVEKALATVLAAVLIGSVSMLVTDLTTSVENANTTIQKMEKGSEAFTNAVKKSEENIDRLFKDAKEGTDERRDIIRSVNQLDKRVSVLESHMRLNHASSGN